jgi:eukaryotic-like serine/threonine-protein kinase
MNPSIGPSPYPGPGEVIAGKYQIEKILGEGGMGCVARAFHRVLHAPVALKFMNPQFLTFPGAVERFINEGKASSLIKSDHIVPVSDAGKTENGTPFLVMECLDGLDLSQLLERDGRPGLPVERSVHFLLQILRGLQAAHGIGIVHRDMKPSNCFVVNKDGEEDFIKLLDFGISKVQQPGSASLTQTNSALGTPLYMSPEQARSPRDVDARSDLYSVGVILYELLTGHTPFFSESGEFTEILFKLFTAEPPPIKTARPDVPDELARAVHTALARDPKDRFEDALAMAEALAPFGSERSRDVVARMRTFKDRTPAGSMGPPAQALPESMVAFSELPRAPSTELLPGGPAAPFAPTPPAPAAAAAPNPAAIARTELLAEAPVPRPAPESSPPSHTSAVPAAMETRARPDEAAARTQYDSLPEGSLPAALAVTDLGAAADAASVEKKRSPLVFVIPALALLAGGLVLLGVTRLGAPDDFEPPVVGTGIVTAPDEILPVTPPPPLTPAPAAAVGDAEAPADDAPPPPDTTVKPKRPPRPPPKAPPGGGAPPPIDPLDIGIHR